jgi:hypothetical protein
MPRHPHDGYAYDRCVCTSCVSARVTSNGRHLAPEEIRATVRSMLARKPERLGHRFFIDLDQEPVPARDRHQPQYLSLITPLSARQSPRCLPGRTAEPIRPVGRHARARSCASAMHAAWRRMKSGLAISTPSGATSSPQAEPAPANTSGSLVANSSSWPVETSGLGA